MLQFVARQGQQREKRNASGERLAHRFGQQEVLGSGDDEPSRLVAGINHFLQIGEQFRHALRLVENYMAFMAGKKTPGVGVEQGPHVGIFEGKVLVCGESVFRKGGFAALARAGDGNHRQFLCLLCNLGFCVSRDHENLFSRYYQICINSTTRFA